MQPDAIKTFLDKALTTPEDQLADALEAFTWKADKVSLSSFLQPARTEARQTG